MKYINDFLVVCGIAGVIDVLFCRGKIGVFLSDVLLSLFRRKP